MKKRLMFLLIFGVVCLILTDTANACSCFSPPTVEAALDDSKNVAIFKVQSVEKYAGGEEDYGYGGFKLARLTVEKVFKGNLKVGQEFAFKQGGGGDCIFTYNEKSVGGELLLFLDEKPKKNEMWEAFICSRSNSVMGAAADLLYLEKMEKLQGKTRLSGTLIQEIESAVEEVPSTYKRLAGRKVIISGNDRNIELKTDKNGVYEIYDLPAGKYKVAPEQIVGFRFCDENKTSVEVEIDEESHTEEDFDFEIHNAIRGKVFDTNGRPLKNVCLDLLPARGKPAKRFSQSDCTNEKGMFEFDEIPPETYLLVINKDGEISSEEPFGTFYYPSATKRDEAAEVTIGAGDFFDNLIINAPQTFETVTVSGVLLFEDGKPVFNESVEFFAETENSKPRGKYSRPDARATTDEKGRFSIKILKGQTGKLSGSFSTYEGKYKNCPKLDRLISEKGERFVDIETSAIQIEAITDLLEIELKFPFPKCEKSDE